MPVPSPPLVKDTLDDLAGKLEDLVKRYTGWQPGKADGAAALVRIWAGMAAQVADRLNRVPDRSFLAYLNLLGAEQAPPRAARVPLTFSPSEGSTTEPVVPAGTCVGAVPTPDDAGEVVFETTRDLVVAQARIAAVFVRQVEGDRYADRTAQAAAGGRGYYEAFVGDRFAEHVLYFSDDAILGLPAGTPVTLRLGFEKADDANAWNGLQLAWSYSNGDLWQTLPSSPATSSTAWMLDFALPADLNTTVVNGMTARWIRARLTAWPSPAIKVPVIKTAKLSATLHTTGLLPDVALAGSRPLDHTMDFYPLGEQPRFNDTFYIGSDGAFSRRGAQVGVTGIASEQQAPLGTEDKPELAWEIWTGREWRKLTPTKVAGGDPLWTVRFTLPDQLAPLALYGQASHWLRVRLVKGDFGKGIQVSTDRSKSPPVTTVIDDGYRPPILRSLTLGYDDAPSLTPVCVASNDLRFTTCNLPFVPFERAPDVHPALYIGFDRRLPNRPMLLYVAVAPVTSSPPGPAPTAPRVVWEYWAESRWAALDAMDGTRGFAESGLVEFVGPVDAAAAVFFGQECCWVRARLDQGGHAVAPRVGCVLLNTVWATHTVTLDDEELGSSNFSAGQVFTLTHAPVLAGERIKVREPAGAADPEGAWVYWQAVPDFHGSGPNDRHYVIDRVAGSVTFGDGVAGMVPPRGARNVRASYQTGGGVSGNRPAGAVNQLKTTLAYVGSVENHVPASGGAGIEPLERLKERMPAALRHRGRAVAAVDFEDLAREASPEVARARAIMPRFDPIHMASENPPKVADAGCVTVIIVSFGEEPRPSPSAGLLQDVEGYVRARATPCMSLQVAGPDWIEVDVDVTVEPASLHGADALRAEIVTTLERFYHPLRGGPEGSGWAFGRSPFASEAIALVGSLPGIGAVRKLSLSLYFAASGGDRVPFDPDQPGGRVIERILVSSGQHTVALASPGRGA